MKTLLLSLLPGLALCGSAVGQGYRTELVSHTTLAIATSDLDGDGDVDIVSGGIRNLLWYVNDGTGHFEQRVVSLDAQEAQCVLVEDLDQDGHKDILVADMAVNRILYYRNNGDDNFDRYFLHTASGGVSGIAVADIDGDGDLDLACAAFTANKVYWLRNNGGFAFTPVDVATGQTGVAHVQAYDYDGDGDIDLAAALQTAGAIRLYRNNGDATFTNELLATMTTPRRLVQDDIDQDGDMDLLYAGGGGTGYFRNQGGSFTQQSVFTYNGARGVGAADLNGDGYKDLLVADYNEDDMLWRGYSANGTFSAPGATLDTDFDYASLIMGADLDGDGDQDVVAASSFDIRVYINPATTGFERRRLNRYLGDARGVCHADFDNDGDIDMMAAGGLYLDWYQNDGTGKLTAYILREGVARIQISGGQVMRAADMDGDGDADAVFCERGGNKVSWIENLGGGAFAKRLVSSLTDAYSCDPVDFDGDGDMDVVASSLNNGSIYWYENNGSQSFTSHTVNTSYPQPYEIRALDYDNDGDTDVLSACYSNLQQVGKLIIHRNTGSSFQAVEVDASAPGVTSCYWVDLDSDGDVDIVATMADQDRVNWYENNGAPSPFFTEHALAYGVGYATYIVADDLDGDGDMDLVTSALDDRTTDWFENDGAQVFTRHELARNIVNPQFVGTGDIDGDGTPEIYASCTETEAVHLYHRTGISIEAVVGPEPQPCHDLFISEMVHQPGDIALALEIYNPRSVPVDLTGYAMRFYPNGQHTYDGSMLTGIIPPGGTHVVVAPNYATNINTYADQITNLWFDGAETIVLVNGDTPIDVIGRVGEYFEDGDYWFSGGVGTFYTVLVRKPTVDRGDADGTDPFLPDAEWIAYNVNDYSHLGSHQGPCGGVCTPTVSLSVPEGPYCVGDDVLVTASITDGGDSPSFQWTVNGMAAGTAGASLQLTGLSGQVAILCTLLGNAACASATSVTSEVLLLEADAVQAPVAVIAGSTVSASPVAGADYQWYFNGDPIPGGEGASITVSIPGDYAVVATVDGCVSPLSNAVTYDLSTGLGMAESAPFRLVPNPTEGPLNIRSDSVVGLVEVWNDVGQKVMEHRGLLLDLSPLRPGLYQVVVHTGQGRWNGRVLRR